MTKMTAQYVKDHLPVIRHNACKFDRGHMLLIAGSYGMAGAAVMAAKAALKSGVGYLSVCLPESVYPVFTAAVPEAVCLICREDDPGQTAEKLSAALEKADAVAVGPGLGKNRDHICPFVFENCKKKLLIDADGLNALAGMKDARFLSEDVVLTPHSGEAGRLLGIGHAEIDGDREKYVRLLAAEYGASVLLKGSGTLVFREGRALYLNETGNPGLARAGSGDVLSGIIGSFMAQGAEGFDAACMGAYVHGCAGDLAAKETGMRSMGPFDVIDRIRCIIN